MGNIFLPGHYVLGIFTFEGKLMTENREIKSSVFTDLFGDDELVGKKNFLALYNAMHGTNLKLEETHMERKIIPQSLVKSFSTDVTMEINGRLIVFVEHQSTINNNMPLRFLEYFVHILYGIVPSKARYRKYLYKIPTPEFYVLYNGTEPIQEEVELKLSDAFLEMPKDIQCELRVKVINIGGKQGFKLPIVQNCDILKEYCKFMEMVLSTEASLKPESTKEDAIVCLEEVIRECIKEGILIDYLTRKGTEVINMFLDEYDYDTDIAVQREEAWKKGNEQGLEQGLQQGLEQGLQQGIQQGAQQQAIEDAIEFLKENITPEKVAKCVKLPIEKVLELQSQLPKKA
ncbi:MAG: hypothetical protein IKR45_04280 [Treponema sp.]|nr:hypothetical protein [Treponema sp.]